MGNVKTRADMAAYIKEKSILPTQMAAEAAYLAVEWLLNVVASGEKVELRGFGTFYLSDVKERKSNLTGSVIPAHKSVKFKSSAELKRLLPSVLEESTAELLKNTDVLFKSSQGKKQSKNGDFERYEKIH